MIQKRVLVPTDGPECWKSFLADPEKQWKSGYSAMSTAYSWENDRGLPSEISKAFSTCGISELQNPELALAIPEYKVSLPGGPRPSQNDVFALVSCSGGLAAMMVEGKAREDFDKKLKDWKKSTSPNGVEVRLSFILKSIGLQSEPDNEVRYQLLHRSASAVIEARRFHAKYAILLIQSFVESDQENHYDDFARFLSLYEQPPSKGNLVRLAEVEGIQFFAGWVQSCPT